MVTGSDFAFMGIHSKCAMLKVCGVFEVEDPPSTSDEPTERNRFVFGKPTPWTELWEFENMERNQKLETRMRDPMCFTLEPTEATSQIRSCLKEASSSSLIREYSVRLDEGLLTRSIILLYPQDNNQQPKEIHRSCQHLNLAVDSSKYVPVAECRKLSVQTSIVETTTSFVEPTRSTQKRMKHNTPTASHGTKEPITFLGTPSCMKVLFKACSTIAKCMEIFLRGIEGVAVLLHIDGMVVYFYLFGSKETHTPLANLRPICEEYHFQHFDVSESLSFQISSWQSPQSNEVVAPFLPFSYRECTVVYHNEKYKDCITCIQQLGDETAIRKMTGATILLSMTEKFNKAKLAPCIANPDVPSGCSYYNLLPRKMCQYIKGDLPEDSDPDHLYPVYFYDAVTLVNWLDLNRACLEDLALHHSVLLVSLEQNYVYMLRGEHSDPILNQCGTQYKTNDFHMYVRLLPAISSQEMTNIKNQS